MEQPLVSIITPTWQRHESLLSVCIPSVERQTYPNIQHVIVSDGPDPELRDLLEDQAVTYLELSRNWRQFMQGASVGAVPRNAGLMMATGEYIGYLDDDDEFLPDHVESLVNLIEERGVDFAWAQMQRDLDGVKDLLIGDGSLIYGHVGSPIIHKVECLRAGFWPMHGYSEDFDFVKQMADAGFRYAFLPRVTLLYHKKK